MAQATGFETYSVPKLVDIRPVWWGDMMIGYTYWTREHRLGNYALWKPSARVFATRSEAIDAADKELGRTAGNCAHCGKDVESAYGDPDSEEEQG